MTWPMMVPSNGVVPRLSVALNSDSQASKKACFVSRLRSREMLARQFHHPVRFSTHRLKSSGKITTTSHQPGSPEELQHLLSQRFKRRKMIGGEVAPISMVLNQSFYLFASVQRRGLKFLASY